MLVRAQTCSRAGGVACSEPYSATAAVPGVATHEEHQSRQGRHVTLANQSQRLGKMAIPRANETQPSNGTHGNGNTSTRAETNKV